MPADIEGNTRRDVPRKVLRNIDRLYRRPSLSRFVLTIETSEPGKEGTKIVNSNATSREYPVLTEDVSGEIKAIETWPRRANDTDLRSNLAKYQPALP